VVGGSATPLSAVGVGQLLHRAVGEDRADRRVQPGQDPLRLPQRVPQDQARAAGFGVAAPPAVDLREHRLLRRPPVDRQAEGRFGDEGVAAHRLPRRAGRVRLGLVVARDHDDLAAVLDADLRRAEDVTGGVQRYADTVDGDRIPPPFHADPGGVAQPRAQHVLALPRREVGVAPPARVIGVRVRDHRARDRPPGIDPEVAGRAMQPLRGQPQQVCRHRSPGLGSGPRGRRAARMVDRGSSDPSAERFRHAHSVRAGGRCVVPVRPDPPPTVRPRAGHRTTSRSWTSVRG
jgi:hypothetical protein